MTSKTITFVGAGNMASAIICGLLDQGYDPKKITASDRSEENLTKI